MNKIHFIGIGGIGMSALAMLAKSRGFKVSGSDEVKSEITDNLAKKGIKIHIGHTKKNIAPDCSFVVYTLAAEKDNQERKAAQKLKIKQMSYPEVLGEFTKNYKNILVAGTHGKSTVAGMISKILIDCKKDPTVIIGTKTSFLPHGNFRFGKSGWSVLEACEYRRAFLNLKPHISVITNVDSDHLDYYKNARNYLKAFKEFSAKTPVSGYLIINKNDKRSIIAAQSAKGRVIKINPNQKIKLFLPGIHNRSNAALAIAAAKLAGCPMSKILKSISEYKGSWRRFEYKGKISRVLVYDDYAHHPKEIKATLSGTREKFPAARILCIYQPHQYSRTKSFLGEFAKAFDCADEVLVPNIYDVIGREKNRKPITVDKFVAELSRHHAHVYNGHGFENTIALVRKNIKNYDVIIVMGAGDVYKITEKLLKSP